jgi:AcrR family transcriptional regulator
LLALKVLVSVQFSQQWHGILGLAMPRQNKAEIEAEILDVAAGLFARHGFAKTSIQQIADALGYSKAGLLHHHASKKALYEAVIDKALAETGKRIEASMQLPVGEIRDRAIVTETVAHTFRAPGISAFMLQIEREGLSQDPRVIELGLNALAALGLIQDPPDYEGFARRFSALAGASATARLAATIKKEAEFRDHIIATAMKTLGYDSGPIGDEP